MTTPESPQEQPDQPSLPPEPPNEPWSPPSAPPSPGPLPAVPVDLIVQFDDPDLTDYVMKRAAPSELDELDDSDR